MKIYISPPFGQYFHPKHSHPILGSYTIKPRPGRFKQIVKTVRPISNGWVNSIGLRNPGFSHINLNPNFIYSLASIEDGDWEKFLDIININHNHLKFELNFSCPNIQKHGHPKRSTLEQYTKLNPQHLSIKLPPILNQALSLTELALESGIKTIHLSNTIPSSIGGISGIPLFNKNLPIVEIVKHKFPQVKIIAGGGIYNWQNAKDYISAGATHLSLASVFFNPIRGYNLYQKLLISQIFE